MTKVVFFKSGGHFYGFEETGHAGYGESGPGSAGRRVWQIPF